MLNATLTKAWPNPLDRRWRGKGTAKPQGGALRPQVLAALLLALPMQPLFAQSAAAPVEFATAPQASAAPQQAAALGEVVVSSSRISIAGYAQPTPVTVVNVATLEQAAQPDLGAELKNVPNFGAASSPDTTTGAEGISGGSAGLSQVNLRNLGVLRTLVLINGSREVNADIAGGGIDLNTLPSGLIQRVDVVTGGASAAWGSDAVAGVVNIIMNNNLQGFKANVEYGNTMWFDKQSQKLELSGGSSFADGNGHFVMALSYFNQPNNPLYSDADYWQRNGATALVANPNYKPTNGQPQYITIQGAGVDTDTNGGLILSNPAGFGGLNANALRGTQFVGPSATPQPFYFGTTTSNGMCYNGCSAEAPAYIGQNDPLGVPIQNTAFYGHANYKVNDSLTASLEVDWGRSEVNNSSITYQEGQNSPGLTILANNAYLPASVAATMATLGIPSFLLGSSMLNDLAPLSNPLAAAPNTDLGSVSTISVRSLYRGVLGLDGLIGKSWTWSGRYQHSENDRDTTVNNTLITANLANAVNAVYVTAANVGKSGLPIGSIACQSTLANPTNGCVPLDVFGTGVASPQAIAYINPGCCSTASLPSPREDVILRQDTVDLTFNGTPFSTWAGPVAVALGADYRREAATQLANDAAALGKYVIGDYSNFVGSYSTKEAFAEVNAPLLRQQWVKSVDFDAAGRVTDYSTFGRIETWKFGLVSQLNDDLRIRASYSADLRAPDVYELFNKGTFAIGTVLPNGVTVNSLSGGNPNLQPELSRTTAAGIILTPTWVPGLTMSFDYFSIILKQAVYSPSAVQVYNECAAGVTVYCTDLVPANQTPQGIEEIKTFPINAASETTEGLDFQLDYSHDLAGGKVSLGWLGTYTANLTTSSAVGVQNLAGSLLNDNGGNGIPKLRATAQLTYAKDQWSGTVETRLIGSSAIDNLYHDGSGALSIDNNSIPFVAYLDLRASYIVGEKQNVQIYGAIDNVLDKQPPIIPYGITEAHPGFYVPTNSNYYDILGTVWRVGVRVNLQ